MKKAIAMPLLLTIAFYALLTACAVKPAMETSVLSSSAADPISIPFTAQVVGLQWLNPLQRRDYPTQWQLLWTLGLAKTQQK